MKVKDILLAAAVKLGIADGAKAYFNGTGSECERECDLLLNCFHSVENALALDYFPLYAEEVLRTATGAIQFSAFSHSPVRILSVKNQKGEEVSYSLYPKYLKTGAGTFTVTYTYTPEKSTLDGEASFALSVSERLVVYGVLAEYCMAEARFEEATVWEKKYKNAIDKLYKQGTCTRLRSRIWA